MTVATKQFVVSKFFESYLFQGRQPRKNGDRQPGGYHGGGRPRWIGSLPGSRFFSEPRRDEVGNGIAYLDGPNIMGALHWLSVPSVRGGNAVLDLRRLRGHLAKKGIDRFQFVQPFDPQRSFYNLANEIKRSGWDFVQPSAACIYGCDPTDCTDDYIRHHIGRRAGEFSCVALVSHDGGYRPSIEAYLRGHGRVLVVGFKDRLSGRYEKLRSKYPDRVEIIDLVADAEAVEVFSRRQAASRR